MLRWYDVSDKGIPDRRGAYIMNSIRRSTLAVLVAIAVASCSGTSGNVLTAPFMQRQAEALAQRHGDGGSLGPVLTTSDGGGIGGFGIDENGNDGILSSNGDELSLQTFDATTGKITKTFAIITGRQVHRGSDYSMDGIFEHDIALVDFQRAGNPGKTPTHDMYKLVDPVTGEKISGTWTPPLDLFNVFQSAVNQSTTTSVMLGYQRDRSSNPVSLVVSDVGTGKGRAIALNQEYFFLPTQPQLAQDTIHDRAIVASSPAAGRPGSVPVIFTIDLRSGNVTLFDGVSCDDGSTECGYANGIAYDSATGIACTDTELDAGVEFYNIAQQTGFHVFLPNKASQAQAGWYIVNDPVNKLFLIAQPYSSTSSPSTSSIQVYGEDGTFVESINGFKFYDNPGSIAIDPYNRTGWAEGPKSDQLQEFSY
jgi:hypothetical protein